LYTFATSSRGGINAIGMLSKEYGKNMRVDPEALPIVELDSDSWPRYWHQTDMLVQADDVCT
jgi:hypothetical protein